MSFSTTSWAQQYGIESSYQFGYNLPIHPRYPNIGKYSHTAEVALLQHTQGKKIWSALYKKPTVAYLFGYQTLGNQAILGEAFYVIPCLDFKVFSIQRFDMRIRIGWGVGVVTKSYDSFKNKANIVMGSPINACVTLRTLFRYRILDQLHVVVGGGVTHYSNGGFTLPNLGINIPFAQVGLQYSFVAPSVAEDVEAKILGNLPKLNQSFRPFIRIGLGFTERATTRGPKYPIYIAAIGVSRMMARISKLSLSVEYLYNTASFNFDRHNGAVEFKHFNYARFSIMASHEFLFGHWGIVTAIGVYLNKHRFSRSVIATKMGFNFYFKNYFKKFKHQVWAGCHIRAYAGEAEFVELVLGYNF